MILKESTIKSWFTGVGNTVNSEIIQPFANAEQVIWKYNQAIQHNSLTQKGWDRLLAQSDDGLRTYLTSIKGKSASMDSYNTSLNGNFVGLKNVNSAINEYNSLSSKGATAQGNFAQAVSVSNKNLGNYLTSSNGATASTWGYYSSLVAAKVGTIALKVATVALNAALTIGVSLIVSKLISSLTDLIPTLEKTREAAEGFSSSISDFNENIKENKTKLNELNDRYKELSNGVGALGQNVNLTTSEYDEYKSIISQVSEIMPDLTARYNDQGEKIGFVKEQLVDLNEEYNKYRQNQAIKFIVEGDEDGNTFKDVLNDYKSRHVGNLGIGSGGTTWGDWLLSALLEGITGGMAETFDDMYTSEYKKALYEQLRDATTKNEAAKIINQFSRNADDQVDAFGITARALYQIDDEEFEKWREEFNGYIHVYESEIEAANNKIREGIGVLAESKDSYWDENVSEDERNNISSFLSSMTDDMIESFEDESGNIKQGDLDNFVSKLISGFSNNGEFFDAYSSLMAEEFRNMSYDEAVDAIYEWVSKIAEVTGFDQYKILKMFGLENFGIDLVKVEAGIKTDKKGNVVDESGKTVSVSEALQSLDYEDAKIAERIIGKLKDGETISWKKLLEQIEATKKALKDTDVESTIVSSVKTIAEQLEPQFKELAEAYQKIFTKDGFTLKNVDNSMLEGIRKSFTEIEKDLGIEFDSSELEGFFAVLSNGSSTAEEVQQSFNDLATSYLNSTDVLENLNDETKISVIKQLEQMGVTNANEVVTEALEKAKAKEYVQSKKNIKVTSENIDRLIEEANYAGITTNAYLELTAKEILFNNNKIDTKDKCNQILEIAKTAGIATVTMSDLNNEIAKNMSAKLGSGVRTKTAKEKGIEVIAEKDRTDSNAKGNGNLYKFNGQEFEDYDDVMYYKEAYDTMQLISKAANTQIKYDGNSGTLGDNGDKDSKETFDWIETKFKRIQRVITNLGKTVSATYKTWGKRNNALAQQISKVNEEISTQQQGYDYYISKANSVGLSYTYKNLVQNGAIKISEISDENLKEKIQEYQDWYEKALGCEDAIQDLNDELATLARQKFDNVSAEFENTLSTIEHEMNMLEGYVDQTEARGHFVSTKYYSSMIDLEKNNISTLQSEYNSLNNALTEAMSTGKIEKYSEEWYDMCGQINDVNKEILDANTNLIELQNTMRELEWEYFDKKQEFISQVTGESDWLIGLMGNEKMYDDTGAITKHAQATLGLHAVNYNTYMSQAEDYANELRKINAEIAKDPNNLTLLERRQELLEAQRDMISSAEDEKQAIKDLVSEGYDTFLNAMQEMIDKRKEAMQSIKDLYDYEKNIAELNNEITVLKKQEIALRGDDSEESRAQLQQLQTSLKEARENLEETEYEKYLSDQEEMLDRLYDETEEWINTRLDKIDGLIQGVIDETNENASAIKETLETETRNVGTELSNEMNNIWASGGAAQSVVAQYGSDFSSKLTTTNDTLAGIKASVDAMLKASDVKADTNINSTKESNVVNKTPATSVTPSTNTNSTTNKNTSSSSKSSWGSWFIKKVFTGNKSRLNINTSIVDRLKYRDFDSSASARAKYYKAMGGSGTYTGSSKQNTWMLSQMKSHGYSKGGTIGGLINKSGEDGFILARTGEEVLSLEKISAMKDVFEAMNPIANMLKTMPTYTHLNGIGGNTITNDIDMSIVLEGINNADEFITALKTDKKFEKFIQQITIGNAMGRNTLSKNRY